MLMILSYARRSSERGNAMLANQQELSNLAKSRVSESLDLQTFSESVKIDYPHTLKPCQIADLNNAVNTISKYEELIKGLHKVTFRLFNLWLDEGQPMDSEIGIMCRSVLAIHNALQPVNGHYEPVRGLTGEWNKELKEFERYR